MNTPASQERLRFNMIEQQIRPWDVHDPQVLALLAEIHREDYVPAAHRALAFFDMELPLADGTEPGQTMLAPKIEARMLNDLHVQKHESVLEIGTGSGFMAALLAHRAAKVLTLEIDATLAARATETLRRNGVNNVEVRHADGAKPLPSGPTFDVIVLSGSVARVPQNLMGSLNIGGRLVAIVGGEPMMRAHFVTRVSEGKWETTQPWDTIAPRLLNFPEPSPFRF
ncbi:protein-L-isoaspartate O-methyltransferase family protein [Variovorax arabinosiphilus]|uniref:protein-L-isoaspartate O-methyltransferase family protein n=1 Tax=Variovorax arabinosiphilus TaxID=3053498 RepID=UPI002578725A|nr:MULTISPECIES: protein-L-isoaspartate O-methyltransferase [unclassified Variovorax]MDM0120060.1 protein-L-isoaspartate O-methyltransferase [Variovorax sp. J2L1-78]MDM0128027.1 protein-L-isoaspartate O-methyltransferase [Variovorax sp. J2L1-63]MDM0231727.1 protein-L-isoaspartate O-methyltransferase [Variovorax sp. J2R1-6]